MVNSLFIVYIIIKNGWFLFSFYLSYVWKFLFVKYVVFKYIHYFFWFHEYIFFFKLWVMSKTSFIYYVFWLYLGFIYYLNFIKFLILTNLVNFHESISFKLIQYIFFNNFELLSFVKLIYGLICNMYFDIMYYNFSYNITFYENINLDCIFWRFYIVFDLYRKLIFDLVSSYFRLSLYDLSNWSNNLDAVSIRMVWWYIILNL